MTSKSTYIVTAFLESEVQSQIAYLLRRHATVDNAESIFSLNDTLEHQTPDLMVFSENLESKEAIKNLAILNTPKNMPKIAMIRSRGTANTLDKVDDTIEHLVTYNLEQPLDSKSIYQMIQNLH